jgi:hypothetical protein
VDERACQGQLLLHAAGQSIGAARPELGQPRHLEQPIATRFVVGNAVNVGEEGDVLVDREIAVEAEALRQVPHPLGYLAMLAEGISVGNAHDPGLGPQQSAHHADHRRLPRTVRADDAEHLAALHGAGHVRERRRRAVPLRDVLEANRRH